MKDRKFTKDHEWIDLKDDVATVGITNHAQDSLGDIVFIDLPEIGKVVNAGDEVSVIESVKAASDIYAPVNGEVIEINDKLKDEAGLINQDAENLGWIFKVKISDSSQLNQLMNLNDYNEFLKEN